MYKLNELKKNIRPVTQQKFAVILYSLQVCSFSIFIKQGKSGFKTPEITALPKVSSKKRHFLMRIESMGWLTHHSFWHPIYSFTTPISDQGLIVSLFVLSRLSCKSVFSLPAVRSRLLRCKAWGNLSGFPTCIAFLPSRFSNPRGIGAPNGWLYATYTQRFFCCSGRRTFIHESPFQASHLYSEFEYSWLSKAVLHGP